jgi:hypothetical protein
MAGKLNITFFDYIIIIPCFCALMIESQNNKIELSCELNRGRVSLLESMFIQFISIRKYLVIKDTHFFIFTPIIVRVVVCMGRASLETKNVFFKNLIKMF